MRARGLSAWTTSPLWQTHRFNDPPQAIHAGVVEQGNLVHNGGALLCWCCPGRAITEDGTAMYLHRRINFN